MLNYLWVERRSLVATLHLPHLYIASCWVLRLCWDTWLVKLSSRWLWLILRIVFYLSDLPPFILLVSFPPVGHRLILPAGTFLRALRSLMPVLSLFNIYSLPFCPVLYLCLFVVSFYFPRSEALSFSHGAPPALPSYILSRSQRHQRHGHCFRVFILQPSCDDRYRSRRRYTVTD